MSIQHGVHGADAERGLTQRTTALNLFLKDVYTDALVLKDGIVPRVQVYSVGTSAATWQGVNVRHDVYVSVAGTDLVRLPDGSFAVLEENLRVPSGVSYMLTNRQVVKRVFPLLLHTEAKVDQRLQNCLLSATGTH